MTTPTPVSRTDRSDLVSIIIICALVVLMTLPEVIRTLTDRSFNTRLSAAVDGGLPIDQLSTGATALLGAGLVVKILSLFLVAACLALAARPMLRGEFFARRNSQLLMTAGYGLIGWVIGRFALEGLGNNMAAAQLGLDHWFDGPRTPSSELALVFLFGAVLLLFAVVIRRGTRLQEDVDGLV